MEKLYDEFGKLNYRDGEGRARERIFIVRN
jgi:hypothetical protein